MFDRFTDRAKKVMNLARQEAQRFHHEYLGTEHVLLGLVQEGSGVRRQRSQEHGRSTSNKIRTEVEKIVKTGPNDGDDGPTALHAAREEGTRALHGGGRKPRTQLHRDRAPLARPHQGERGHRSPSAPEPRRQARRRTRGSARVLGCGHGRRGRGRGRLDRRARTGPLQRRQVEDAGSRLLRSRPHRAGAKEGKLDNGDRSRQRDRARDPDPLATYQEQPRAARRAGRRQDRHRRGPGAAHHRQQGARDPAQQAHRRARPGVDGRWHQVPRTVRGAHQGRHDRSAPRARRRALHRRAAHAGRRPVAPRARSTPPTCSSRPYRAARSSASARPPWTSTASTSRRTAPSSVASSRSTSSRRRPTETVEILKGLRDRYEAAPPRQVHRRGSQAWPSSCRRATSTTASCRTRPST